MRMLLLPGFYGTGELFAPLRSAFTQHFAVEAVRYEDQRSLEDYIGCVEALLPERDAILVAESFSGPIALALMARNPTRFRCAILSATFAVSPYRVLAALARYLPTPILGPSWVSRYVVRQACLDATATPALLSATYEVMRSLSGHRVKTRFKLLGDVNVRPLLPRVTVPILYLQAARDRVVSTKLTCELTDALPQVEVQVIDGPHFLLQTRPHECARAIEAFVSRHI